MNDSSRAIMFLAAERGHTENNWHRSYATFGTTVASDVQKPAFGSLYKLNDDTLAGGKSTNVVAKKSTNLLLLPTVGELIYQHQDSVGEVQAGEAVVFLLAAGQSIQLVNPFDEELVNYLQLWFNTDVFTNVLPSVHTFNLDAISNQFTNIIAGLSNSDVHELSANISIGKFDGRAEAVLSVGEKNGLFVFVLQGAFEVQYRLLESRDGMALWNVADVEIEAVSNEAILLAIELVL